MLAMLAAFVASPAPGSAAAYSAPTPALTRTPELRSVAFSTATIRTGRVVVAKIDCTDISAEDLACVPTSAGYDVEVLPSTTRQGRHLVVGLRIHRRLGTPHSLCSIRFSAGDETALASVTVLN